MNDNDLISRAELLNDLSYCAPELWQDEEYIQSKIMKQPAVDAVPVRHGRWIMNGPGFNCSACSGWVDSEIYYMLSPRQEPKCCPYCGAKMDDDA